MKSVHFLMTEQEKMDLKAWMDQPWVVGGRKGQGTGEGGGGLEHLAVGG